MSHEDVIEKIAATLYKAEKEALELDKFTGSYPELNDDLAYRIQDRLIEVKCTAENTKISGWKLGLTSKAKQRMIGVYEPSYGVLLENMLLPEETPISLAPFIHPKIEPEIAFVLKHELKGPGVSVPDVLHATAYIMPALEMIDSRYRSFSLTLPDGIADNSSSSRYILGGQWQRPEKADLRLMGMVFKKNGRVVSTSAGAAVMGHPARAIAWMVNKLAKVGKSVKPGEVVLSGALCESLMITEGDVITMSLDGIGSATALF